MHVRNLPNKFTGNIHVVAVPLGLDVSFRFTPLFPTRVDLWLHNHNRWRAAALLHDSNQFPGCQLHHTRFCLELNITGSRLLINNTNIFGQRRKLLIKYIHIRSARPPPLVKYTFENLGKLMNEIINQMPAHKVIKEHLKWDGCPLNAVIR